MGRPCACHQLRPKGLAYHLICGEALGMQGLGALARVCQIHVTAYENMGCLVAAIEDVVLGVKDLNAGTQATTASAE